MALSYCFAVAKIQAVTSLKICVRCFGNHVAREIPGNMAIFALYDQKYMICAKNPDIQTFLIVNSSNVWSRIADRCQSTNNFYMLYRKALAIEWGWSR